jgi:hypothetical protein
MANGHQFFDGRVTARAATTAHLAEHVVIEIAAEGSRAVALSMYLSRNEAHRLIGEIKAVLHLGTEGAQRVVAEAEAREEAGEVAA